MPLTKEEWNVLKPTLRMLWGEGHSTAEIGRRMGLTKNTIIGAAHRLDLPPRESPIIRDPERIASVEERREKQRQRDAARYASRSTIPPLKSVAEAISTPPDAVTPIPDQIIVTPPEPAYVPHGGRDHRLMMTLGRGNALSERGPTLPPIAAEPPPVPLTPRPFARVRECTWPIGEPGTPTYRTCDAPADGGRPYCGEHCAVAYVRAGGARGRDDTYEAAHRKGAHMATWKHQSPLTRPVGRNIMDED